MPPEDSVYSPDWLRIAEKDLIRAEHLLSIQDVEGAAFHLQQAVEKFLKAFLLRKGWKLKRTHDLETLLDDAIRYDSSLEAFRSACEEITNYYVIERYPLSAGYGISEREVRDSLTAVREFIEKLRAGAA